MSNPSLQSCVVMHSVCYCEEIQDIRAGATVVCIFFHLYLLCTYRTITRGPFWVFNKITIKV